VLPALRPEFNIRGVADGGPWSHVLPGCQSVWVIGAGGTALFDAFMTDVALEPTLLEGSDPFDRWCRAQLPETPGGKWVLCDMYTDVPFQRLALAAGLGVDSRLGLLLHPEFGPWWSLRAAWFTTHELPGRARELTSPCEQCSAPCEAACPAGAIAGRWRAEACLQARAACGVCDARGACPEGARHRYSELQRRYHHGAGSDEARKMLQGS